MSSGRAAGLKDDMTTGRSITLCAASALFSIAAIAQEVHVTSENGIVTMSVAAQKPYLLIATGQPRTPLLTISCQQKGKKAGHSITFSPGGILAEQQYSTFGSSASLPLEVTLGERKVSTNWVAYGNVETFAYYGKTEQERLIFLHALLSVPSVTIEFTPFLTGVPSSSTFDLTELRAQFDKRSECSPR